MKKRFVIEFTVEAEDFSDEWIKGQALQELNCMSPFPEDIDFYRKENPWHTGTPTEDGTFIVLWEDTDEQVKRYSKLHFNKYNNTWYDEETPDCNWGDEYHAKVIIKHKEKKKVRGYRVPSSLIDKIKRESLHIGDFSYTDGMDKVIDTIKDLGEVELDNPWHTGEPTEEGWYLITDGQDNYDVTYWFIAHIEDEEDNEGEWDSTYLDKIVAWQKIVPCEA